MKGICEMKEYKSIYPFEAITEISNGKKVRILDKHNEKVYVAEEMYVTDFTEIINSEDKARYEFWVVYETEEVDSNEQ